MPNNGERYVVEIPIVVGIASDYWEGYKDCRTERGQAWRAAVVFLWRSGATGKQKVRYLMNDGDIKNATVTARNLER